MTSPDEVIAANRARRVRSRRRRKAARVFNLVALIAAVRVDTALGWPSDGGSAPLVTALAGCTSFGILWLDARREGIERELAGRAAMIATSIVLAYGVGAYVIWLLDDSIRVRPGVTLLVTGVGLMVGMAFARGRSEPGESNE